MPLSGDPLLASLLRADIRPLQQPVSPTVVSRPSSSINIPGRRGTPQQSSSAQCNLDFSHDQDAVIDAMDVNLQTCVPKFSYSYQSPVCSPPLDRVHPESLSSAGLSVPKASSLLNLPGGKKECLPNSTPMGRYGSEVSISLFTRQKSSSDEGKLARKKSGWNESFLESGGMVLPPAIGHFPRPQEGQTLTSFLSSLSDNLPDLDRENAHFNVSEALISAFERIKIQKYQDKLKAQSNEESDQEDVFGTVENNSAVNTSIPPEGTPCSSKSARRYRERKLDQSFTETEESEYDNTFFCLNLFLIKYLFLYKSTSTCFKSQA